MKQQIRPSQIVIMASGGIMFLLTAFLPFYSFDGGPAGDTDWSIWTSEAAIFPVATYMPLIGLAMAVLVGLTAFANVKLPPRVIGFTWTQIYLVLSVFAGLLALGWLMAGSPRGGDVGIGLWLAVLGSAGLITGAVMEFMEEKKASAPGGYPGQPPYPGQQGPPPGQPPQQPYPGQPGPPPGQPPYPGQQGPPPGQPPQQF